MAYDTDLADRVRELVATEPGLDERRMFGGLAFLINGNLSVAASNRGGLLVRVPPADTEDLTADDRVEPMVMAGQPRRGWLHVAATADDDGWVAEWVGRGVAYARSLPVKRGR
ncbi:TfoX/Sxy family protein [Actinophytocola sp. NPDC049390]|uniref:TfoX/Sxy family protein n=1 Tax=Actinophytocola sp. NPDC049390 TaxID=3363894 RepID=UPI0037A3E7F6